MSAIVQKRHTPNAGFWPDSSVQVLLSRLKNTTVAPLANTSTQTLKLSAGNFSLIDFWVTDEMLNRYEFQKQNILMHLRYFPSIRLNNVERYVRYAMTNLEIRTGHIPKQLCRINPTLFYVINLFLCDTKPF
jgi:hypothetical protein